MKRLMLIAALALAACGGTPPTNVCSTPLDVTPCMANGVAGYVTESGQCYVDPNPDCRLRAL